MYFKVTEETKDVYNEPVTDSKTEDKPIVTYRGQKVTKYE